nr:AgmX/PglI C-terminal domain-containing protein [Myxococcota bacterium]
VPASAPVPPPPVLDAPRSAVRLGPAVLLETIETSYVGALRRCYTARLKRDRSARGRVIVTFTVDGRGRLSDGRARGAGKQIESCIERAMTRWEFPPARKADGSPTETTFRLALQLTAV